MCYDSKHHKVIVAQDRIMRKTCKLLVCLYSYCLHWGLVQSAKPQGRVSCGNPLLCRQWWHDRNPRKARFIRRIFAVSNSMKRIKFGRRSTSESAVEFLPHVQLVLSHYPTEMRHRFKRRISAMSNLIKTTHILRLDI